jgi:hypothetical protein
MTTLQPPANIHAAVESVAMQYGVPDGIWEDVAYVESGYNPTAHNPSGAYGLFQLLTPGGQGDAAIAAGHSINDLYDPTVNAQYAMPAIASAWNHLKTSFSSQDVGWWEKFAAQSGHPGGASGQAYTDQVAQQLETNYLTIEYGVTSSQGLQAGVNADKSVPASGQTVAATADNLTGALSNLTSFFSNITWLQQHWQSGLIKIGIFIGALLLLGAGLFIVLRKNA